MMSVGEWVSGMLPCLLHQLLRSPSSTYDTGTKDTTFRQLKVMFQFSSLARMWLVNECNFLRLVVLLPFIVFCLVVFECAYNVNNMYQEKEKDRGRAV